MGQSRYCMKLGAKWAEPVQLMQKFVPQSRVLNFCNERTRHTPLDPKLMFLCVSYRLGTLGTISLCTKLGVECANMVQLMQKVLQLSRIGVIRNEHSRSTPLDYKHMLWCIS